MPEARWRNAGRNVLDDAWVTAHMTILLLDHYSLQEVV